MTTKSTYDWVSYVERAILDLDDIPLLGQAPSFPWEAFTNEFSAFLGIKGLQIKPVKWNWFSPSSLSDNLGDDVTCLNFSVLPLQGKVSLLLPAMDVNSLMTWLVEKKAGMSTLINSQFVTGLLAYVSVEALHHLEKNAFFDGFLLRYLSDESLPSARALGVDIQMKAYGETLTCRLLLPEIFRKNWITHFLERPKHLSEENKENVQLLCTLEAGHIRRDIKEWKEIEVGDFVPVENCQVDPEAKTGSLNLTIGRRALFRVRIKDMGLKILEQIIYEEEPLSMDDEIEFYSEVPGESFDESEVESEEVNMLDDSLEEGDEGAVPVKEEGAVLETINKVPLNISVELTRFKMTCGKLMQLKPGNFLELNLQPEKPVDLVANGKKIAEGELVRIGEVLGVRILNIG